MINGGIDIERDQTYVQEDRGEGNSLDDETQLDFFIGIRIVGEQ